MKYIKRYNEDIDWEFDYEEENHDKWNELLNLLDKNNNIIVDIHKNDINKFDEIISKYGKTTFSSNFYNKIIMSNKHPYEDIGHIYIEKSKYLSYMPLPRGYEFDKKEKYDRYIYLDLTK